MCAVCAVYVHARIWPLVDHVEHAPNSVPSPRITAVLYPYAYLCMFIIRTFFCICGIGSLIQHFKENNIMYDYKFDQTVKVSVVHTYTL